MLMSFCSFFVVLFPTARQFLALRTDLGAEGVSL